jgi:DNA modification methylase
LNVDFHTWADTYSGPKFNLLHCDFPYGANFNSGPQSGRDKWETYADGEDVYWKLIDTLCTNLDKIMSVSGHLMFWLSADVPIMFNTLRAFSEKAPGLRFHSKPLIWLKSDNVGILSDPQRWPRHIYETCLIASREDRKIIRAVSDAYSAPTDKAHHPSAKPEPVLRHFMGMFVDEQTRFFDPTAGGGSSLRAAESLGATTVLGLELSPEHASNANSAMRKFRALRKISK